MLCYLLHNRGITFEGNPYRELLNTLQRQHALGAAFLKNVCIKKNSTRNKNACTKRIKIIQFFNKPEKRSKQMCNESLWVCFAVLTHCFPTATLSEAKNIIQCLTLSANLIWNVCTYY